MDKQITIAVDNNVIVNNNLVVDEIDFSKHNCVNYSVNNIYE